MKMNSALKMISLLSLIALATSFPASQINAPHDQLANSAPRQSQYASSSPIAAAPLPAEIETGPTASTRTKRAIIFRPLFVYRQQQVEKQRLREERRKKQEQQSATAQAKPVAAGSRYAPNYYYNKNNCNC